MWINVNTVDAKIIYDLQKTNQEIYHTLYISFYKNMNFKSTVQ